jgi:hypothetical protein
MNWKNVIAVGVGATIAAILIAWHDGWSMLPYRFLVALAMTLAGLLFELFRYRAKLKRAATTAKG